MGQRACNESYTYNVKFNILGMHNEDTVVKQITDTGLTLTGIQPNTLVLFEVSIKFSTGAVGPVAKAWIKTSE